MTVAATTGPTPKMPVRLVPEARTAVLIFARASRSWVSMRRRSARCSAARSYQAWPAGPAGRCASRIEAARFAVMTLGTPPGDELAQHGMQPARGLGAQRGQLAVAA